ncbi:hypothetical protein [Lysinibacillus xylanilyticus]
MQMSIYLYLAIYYVAAATSVFLCESEAAATSVFCAKAKRQQQL